MLFLIIFLWEDIMDKNYPRYLYLDKLLRADRTTKKETYVKVGTKFGARGSVKKNIQIDCEKYQNHFWS